MKPYYHTVICPECGEKHDASQVKFVNIEEDIDGADVLHYECPILKTITKSRVYRNIGYIG